MARKARVTLENAYRVGDEIYATVEATPYLVDTGAEVSMTLRSLETAGHLAVQLANRAVDKMPYGIWKGIIWVKGLYNLITVKDLEELSKVSRVRGSWRRKLDKLRTRLIQNDCGDLGSNYVHTIEGGVHPPVRQYPLNPGAVAEMDMIVRELNILGIIREEPNPVTNSPIQAVKKPEATGGGWRPVINFKALNRRTAANRASLINPQGALKTLQVKKFKSCIDLANGFFSLRLSKQSQGKTAFTHRGRAYVWQRLPQGYKNSPNVFQSAVMDVLSGLETTIYIDDVFIADDTEDEHLEKLQKQRGGGNGDLVELYLINGGKEISTGRKGASSPGQVLGRPEGAGPRPGDQGHHPESSPPVPQERYS
uniref:ribonuclease H n=1 Tax=Sparus aurata TaxID=8175 RepID=A0A671TJW7_SPAAU